MQLLNYFPKLFIKNVKDGSKHKVKQLINTSLAFLKRHCFCIILLQKLLQIIVEYLV